MFVSFPRVAASIALLGIAVSGCSGAGGGGSVAPRVSPAPGTSSTLPAPRYFSATAAAALGNGAYICIPTLTSSASSCDSPLSNPSEYVEIDDYSFGVTNTPQNPSVSAGGKATFSDFALDKTADTSSPAVQLAYFRGTTLPAPARLALTTAAGGIVTVYSVIDFGTAKVSAESLETSTGSGVRESITLSYGSMQFAYRPQTPSGAFGDPLITCFSTIVDAAQCPAGTRPLDELRAPASVANARGMSSLGGALNEVLSLTGVHGDSNLVGYRNAIDLQSVQVAAFTPSTTTKPTSSMVVQKAEDRSSPVLWQRTATGQPFRGSPSELDLISASNATKQGYWLLRNPVAVTYGASGASGQRMNESLSFTYDAIQFCDLTQTDTGAIGAPVCSSWNFMTNTSTF